METEYVELTLAVPASDLKPAVEDLRKYVLSGGPMCIYRWECKDDQTYENLIGKLPSFCVYERQQTFTFEEAPSETD